MHFTGPGFSLTFAGNSQWLPGAGLSSAGQRGELGVVERERLLLESAGGGDTSGGGGAATVIPIYRIHYNTRPAPPSRAGNCW